MLHQRHYQMLPPDEYQMLMVAWKLPHPWLPGSQRAFSWQSGSPDDVVYTMCTLRVALRGT